MEFHFRIKAFIQATFAKLSSRWRCTLSLCRLQLLYLETRSILRAQLWILSTCITALVVHTYCSYTLSTCTQHNTTQNLTTYRVYTYRPYMLRVMVFSCSKRWTSTETTHTTRPSQFCFSIKWWSNIVLQVKCISSVLFHCPVNCNLGDFSRVCSC